MLSWEFPPNAVGGLAKHVEELSEALGREAMELHVLTVGSEQCLKAEKRKNVWIHRVEPYPLQTQNFIMWIQNLNLRFVEEAIALIRTWGPFDLIHSHDWLTGHAGRVLKAAYKIPLVATIHATEAGRNHGLYTTEQHYINQIEWWLTYEAWKVIVCSQHMHREVRKLFNLPHDKIKVVPNGVDYKKFTDIPLKNISFGPEKIVFFVGRLVKEKGVHVLLEAAPKIIAAEPNVQFIIAGKGPMEAHLKQQAKNLGIDSYVYFLGYVEEEIKMTIYKQATVAVFPSLYEPFGIVALEAMAAGTPVVASDIGGMGEVIEHGQNGLKVYPGNIDSLASKVLKVLQKPDFGKRLQQNGLKIVKEQYAWEQIAKKTRDIYLEILQEYQESSWGNKEKSKSRNLAISERGL